MYSHFMLPNEHSKLRERGKLLRQRRGHRLDFHHDKIEVYTFSASKVRTPP
jgi:hypothetical protein